MEIAEIEKKIDSIQSRIKSVNSGVTFASLVNELDHYQQKLKSHGKSSKRRVPIATS